MWLGDLTCWRMASFSCSCKPMRCARALAASSTAFALPLALPLPLPLPLPSSGIFGSAYGTQDARGGRGGGIFQKSHPASFIEQERSHVARDSCQSPIPYYPVPCTLYPTTLFPVPHTLYPVPWTLFPLPRTPYPY